jgi:uncharacterized membrane protein YadS
LPIIAEGRRLLYALLLGMALNPIAVEGRARAGVDFAARRILRLGVALLGRASRSTRSVPSGGRTARSSSP